MLGKIRLTKSGAKSRAAKTVGFGGQSAGPGDVATAGGIACVVAFHKNPAIALKRFAEREKVGGDVLLAFGESFLRGGELVHESEAEIVFFAGEVYRSEDGGVILRGLPADLAAEAGFIAGGPNVPHHPEQIEEGGLEEIPILGAAGEKAAEPEITAFDFINIDDGEITLATGGDI